MKRMILTIVALITMTLSTNAMSYEQARKEALFLTDKMAYELNLTDDQYEAAYEINVDYLMGVNTVDDLYGTYWTRRNLDLSYILLDWQWNAFKAATYFYRPLYWNDGFWHFGIYARYPRRSYFYFDRPSVFVSYRGGHSWRMNGGRSYYLPRRDEFRRPDNRQMGMRDMWDRGDFRGNMNSHYQPGRGSSTRVTVNNGNRNNSYNNGSSANRNVNFGSSRTQGTFNQNRSESSYSKPNRTGSTFGSSTNGTFGSNRSTGAFGGTRNSSSASKSNGSFGGSVGTGAFGGTRSNSGSFGSSSTRSSNIGGSFGSSRSSSVGGSFGGSRSNGGGSFGGGSTRSAGGNGGGGFSSRR